MLLSEMREKALKDWNSALAEAWEEGFKEGREQALKKEWEKVLLIGDIRLAQFQLKLPLKKRDELAQQTLENLRALYHDLQCQLPHHIDR